MTTLITIERHLPSGVKNAIIPFRNGAAAPSCPLDNDSGGLGLFCRVIELPAAAT
jgi:hypothetical protein